MRANRNRPFQFLKLEKQSRPERPEYAGVYRAPSGEKRKA